MLLFLAKFSCCSLFFLNNTIFNPLTSALRLAHWVITVDIANLSLQVTWSGLNGGSNLPSSFWVWLLHAHQVVAKLMGKNNNNQAVPFFFPISLGAKCSIVFFVGVQNPCVHMSDLGILHLYDSIPSRQDDYFLLWEFGNECCISDPNWKIW